MNKLVLFFTFLSITIFAYSAQADSLILMATVPRTVAITVNPVSVSSALDLSTTQVDLKVATVNEQSNSRIGYKVTITSANLGKLKRANGSEVFSYNMKYGGRGIVLSTAAGSVYSYSSFSIVNSNKDLKISYIGASAETMIEGTYQDTLTFNIASN